MANAPIRGCIDRSRLWRIARHDVVLCHGIGSSGYARVPETAICPLNRSFAWSTLLIASILSVACAEQQPRPPTRQIEVAFSPEAASEALVVKVIDSARHSLRLAGYSFTSPAVVQALIDAKKRSVDVQVLIDDRGNRGNSSVAAMNLIVSAGIPLRTIAAYAIHHDKYIVVDGKTTETGSFNYSQAAARSNSENVLVVWNDSETAKRYLEHWQSRWLQGMAVELSY